MERADPAALPLAGLRSPTLASSSLPAEAHTSEADLTERFIETGRLDTISLPANQTHVLKGDFFHHQTLSFDPRRLGLKLDPAAQEKVEQAFSTALEGFLAWEKQHSRLDTDDEGNQSVVIEPSPEDYREISREFRRSLADVVGPSMAWALSQPYTHRWFPDRGTHWTRLWMEGQSNGWTDLMEQETIRDPGAPTDKDLRMESVTSHRDLDFLRARYGHLFPAATKE